MNSELESEDLQTEESSPNNGSGSDVPSPAPVNMDDILSMLTPSTKEHIDPNTDMHYIKEGSRRRGIWSPMLQQLRAYDKPNVPDETILQMIKDGNEQGNFLLLLKHYPYIVAKILDATQGRWYSDDILQAGAVGLYEAAKRWDPSAKNRFLTYAHYWILKFIYIEIRNEVLPLGGLGMGRDARERLFNYVKYSMMGMSDEELKEKLKVNQKTLNELKILNATATRVKSLDKLANPEMDEADPTNDIAMPTRPSAENEVISQEFIAYLERQVQYLKTVDEQLGTFLEYELGLNGQYQLDKAEICTKLNITKKECERLRREGNKYLRVQLVSDGWYDVSKKVLGDTVSCYAKQVKER